jgi:hypothetical protein
MVDPPAALRCWTRGGYKLMPTLPEGKAATGTAVVPDPERTITLVSIFSVPGAFKKQFHGEAQS